MLNKTKFSAVVIWAFLMMVAVASAQTQRQKQLSVEGYPGKATIVQSQGHAYVEVQDRARITDGTLRLQGDQIVLTVPGCTASEVASNDGTRFSRPFNRAAIEAMASIREWGGMLMITVQDGYPVRNDITGNTIMAYQDRAADAVAVAGSVASTDSDHRGLELLRNEFNNLQAWVNTYIEARRSLSAANLTISESAFQNDEEAQKTIRCGKFLAQMFASGTFQDDAACH